MNDNITLANLQALLDGTFGVKAWQNLEPETLLVEMGPPDYLVAEKVYVLKALNANVNHMLSMPEFLIRATSVCNNEYADFDTVQLPTSLELAFFLDQAKKVAVVTGQTFSPTQELTEILAFMLSADGFSEPVPPFEFVPSEKINPEGHPGNPGATPLKARAIQAYIKHMEQLGHA